PRGAEPHGDVGAEEEPDSVDLRLAGNRALRAPGREHAEPTPSSLTVLRDHSAVSPPHPGPPSRGRRENLISSPLRGSGRGGGADRTARSPGPAGMPVPLPPPAGAAPPAPVAGLGGVPPLALYSRLRWKTTSLVMSLRLSA